MTALTIFGVVTLTAMLVFYTLEARSPVFILLLAGALGGSRPIKESLSKEFASAVR